MADADQPTSTTTAVSIERDQAHVATLWLERPQHGNRIDNVVAVQMHQLLTVLDDDPDITAIVIAGRGADFCLGRDVDALAALDDPRMRRAAELVVSDAMTALAESSKATIARVQGRCCGAGLELVAACDLAIAADDAVFAAEASPGAQWPHAAQVALSRGLPAKLALDMLLTGCEADAATLLRGGLLSRIVARAELDARVADVTHAIATRSPYTVSLGKYGYSHQAAMSPADAYEFVIDQLVYHERLDDTDASS